MHPDLEKLIVLQGLDVEAKRLRDEMAALPKHVAGAGSEGEGGRRAAGGGAGPDCEGRGAAAAAGVWT